MRRVALTNSLICSDTGLASNGRLYGSYMPKIQKKEETNMKYLEEFVQIVENVHKK